MIPKTDPAAVRSTSTVPAAPATASPTLTNPNTPTHCPYRQATLMRQALSPDKMRVAFFLGSGCAVAIQVPGAGGATRPLIPDIKGLTKLVRNALEASASHKSGIAAVIERLAENGKSEPTIEDILSIIRALREVVGKTNHGGLPAGTLDLLDKEICSIITKLMQERLTSDDTPYHKLAMWIREIRREHPVEIFTSNYDLLTDQALEERRVPYFDGFVGADRTFFDLNSIEQDSLPARWARLWKVHGAINWWRTDNKKNVERRAREAAGKEGDLQMIHPSHLKYDESRRMPYLAMLDRLKTFLGEGQSVMVTCGYSFSDEHLNEVILQGLSGNPNAICFGLVFGDRTDSPIAMDKARKHANFNLLAADGAILGTVERDWHSVEKSDHLLHGIAVGAGVMKPRTIAPTERCKFLLGDFNSLGDFLAEQLAIREDVDGN